MNRFFTRAMVLAALALAPTAFAYDLADGRLTIAGFGQAAWGVSDGNLSHGANATPSFVEPNLTLVVTAKPFEELLTSVQINATPTGVGIHWAFAEWRYSDALHLRLGMVKQPFGIFGETRDVGTLRPFYEAPRSVYLESTELTADGLIGVGLNGRADSGSGAWGLNYDLYAGQLRLRTNDMLDQVGGRAPIVPGGVVHDLTEYNTGMLGGRLWLTTPIDGLSVVASGYASFFASDTLKLGKNELKLSGGVSVEYLTDRWMLRSEAVFLYHHSDMRRFAAYLEVGYFITPHLEPAVRGELSQVADFGAASRDAQYLYQREVGAALNYWFNRSFVVRLEYHFGRGNLLDYPEAFADAYLARSTNPNTNVVLLGTQFSF